MSYLLADKRGNSFRPIFLTLRNAAFVLLFVNMRISFSIRSSARCSQPFSSCLCSAWLFSSLCCTLRAFFLSIFLFSASCSLHSFKISPTVLYSARAPHWNCTDGGLLYPDGSKSSFWVYTGVQAWWWCSEWYWLSGGALWAILSFVLHYNAHQPLNAPSHLLFYPSAGTAHCTRLSTMSENVLMCSWFSPLILSSSLG